MVGCFWDRADMTDLIDRLKKSRYMMSIPANNSDEDIFISTAINDAITLIEGLFKKLPEPDIDYPDDDLIN